MPTAERPHVATAFPTAYDETCHTVPRSTALHCTAWLADYATFNISQSPTRSPNVPPADSQPLVVATLVGSIMLGAGCILLAIVYAMRTRAKERSLRVDDGPAYGNIT